MDRIVEKKKIEGEIWGDWVSKREEKKKTRCEPDPARVFVFFLKKTIYI